MSAKAATQSQAPGPTPAPAGSPIALAEPDLGGNEWTYVKACLDSGWVSSVGAFVDRFEAAFARHLGARHAVATVNGTAAIHVALLVAGVRPDDEVLVPSLTFIAPANAIRYAGARPIFVDADPATWQMDVAATADFLARECHRADGALRNRATGRRIGALLPVHVLGHPVDLAPLMELAETFGLPVVEDAAESLGAAYRGRPVGRFGKAGCFSFNGNKVITTGGGGMLVTDDDALAQAARRLSTTAKDDAVEGVHGSVGFNYRLTNLQAAVGCAQLERLDDLIAAKRRIARRYQAALGDVAGLTAMPEAPWATSAFWLYTLRVEEQAGGRSARHLRAYLRERGIDSRLFWQPLHLSPAHAGAQVIGGESAERLHRELLSIPCSCGLSDRDQDRVITAIRDFLGA